MPVLTFVENNQGAFKKASYEITSYGRSIADLMNDSLLVVAFGEVSESAISELKKHGADQIILVEGSNLSSTDSSVLSSSISAIAKKYNCQLVLLSNTYLGKSIAPRISVQLQAGLIPGAIALPEITAGKLSVRRSVFSNKGFADTVVNSTNQVISLTPNSYKLIENPKSGEVIKENITPTASSIKIIDTKKTSGKISLTEAEIVVSGGRGMKTPDNWHFIETLADILGAATACSKPVSDMDWRPHSEHVGQTGITIKPDLYFAIGISGAIQHLAGVSGSKVIVAINTDKEAPFFKAADYGIVGDALEVLPKLIEGFKKYKSAQ